MSSRVPKREPGLAGSPPHGGQLRYLWAFLSAATGNATPIDPCVSGTAPGSGSLGRFFPGSLPSSDVDSALSPGEGLAAPELEHSPGELAPNSGVARRLWVESSKPPLKVATRRRLPLGS